MSSTSSASTSSSASTPSTSATPATQLQPSTASSSALPGLHCLLSLSVPSSSLASSTQRQSPSFIISTVSASAVDDSLLTQCAELFSLHYGVWSEFVSPPLVPGSRVKMTASRMRANLLFDDSCGVVVYLETGRVLGQAFFCTFTVPDVGDVRWITQLVVSSQHRRRGIAEMILNNAMFRHNNLFAVGLVSSHPAAVRALEVAAGARISTAGNLRYAQLIHSHCSVPYLRTSRLVVTDRQCTVDTQFFVDHTEVLAILEQRRQQRPDHWTLGELPESWEFFAIAIITRVP